MGLIFGAFVSLFGLVGAFATSDQAGALGAVFGIAAVMVLPIMYGCIGFVMTLITAALYNVAAKIAGGIEIEVQQQP